jgi:predicted kinase
MKAENEKERQQTEKVFAKHIQQRTVTPNTQRAFTTTFTIFIDCYCCNIQQ